MCIERRRLGRRARRGIGRRRRRGVSSAVRGLIAAKRRSHPHSRERIGGRHRDLRERAVAAQRLHTALGLEVEIERVRDVAAEELRERIIGEPDHLREQLDGQKLRGVAGLEHELDEARLGEILAGLRIDDANIGATADLRRELVQRDVARVARVVEAAIAILLDEDRRHGRTLVGIIAALQEAILLRRKRSLDRSPPRSLACAACRPGPLRLRCTAASPSLQPAGEARAPCARATTSAPRTSARPMGPAVRPPRMQVVAAAVRPPIADRQRCARRTTTA